MELDSDALLGRLLAGKYELVRVLGKGSRGVVFEAVQIDLGRRVALKVLADALDPAEGARLRRDAFALASLNHPHVVQVIDLSEGQPGEPPWLAMDRVDGLTLDKVIESETSLEAERAVRIAIQILNALTAAHEIGIIHRDIRPAHVFLVQTAAAPDFVKLFAFGFAKNVADQAAPATMTSDLGPAAPAVDIHGVGTCLRAMVGEKPRTGNPAASVMLARILADALTEDPARRHGSARAMQKALESWIVLHKAQRRLPPVRRAAPPAPRAKPPPVAPPRRLLFVVGCAGVLVVSLLLLAIWAKRTRPPPAEVALTVIEDASLPLATAAASDVAAVALVETVTPADTRDAAARPKPASADAGRPSLRRIELLKPEAAWLDDATWKTWSARTTPGILSCLRTTPAEFDGDQARAHLAVTSDGAPSVSSLWEKTSRNREIQALSVTNCVSDAVAKAKLTPQDGEEHQVIVFIRLVR